MKEIGDLNKASLDQISKVETQAGCLFRKYMLQSAIVQVSNNRIFTNLPIFYNLCC